MPKFESFQSEEPEVSQITPEVQENSIEVQIKEEQRRLAQNLEAFPANTEFKLQRCLDQNIQNFLSS